MKHVHQEPDRDGDAAEALRIALLVEGALALAIFLIFTVLLRGRYGSL